VPILTVVTLAFVQMRAFTASKPTAPSGAIRENKMKYVVLTQFLENYGAHDADGKFESGNYYWKFKGGSDYLVSGFNREQDAMAYVAHTQCKTTDYGIEVVSEVKTVHEWRFLIQKQDIDEDYQEFLVNNLIHIDFKKSKKNPA